MSWPLVRRIWVTLWNLVFLGFMGIVFLQDYQLSHFSGGTRPPRSILDTLGPLVTAVLLVLGIVLEWLDLTWSALAVNVGFWGLLGIYVLGYYFWMVYTKWPANPDPSGEGHLIISIVGIPFTVIAIADFLLYWTTRPKSKEILERAGKSIRRMS